MTTQTRTDTDSHGPITLPAEALYSAGSVRGAANFNLVGAAISQYPQFVTAMALVKKAAASANLRVGALEADIATAIIAACDEIADGQHRASFIVALAEGSGGTSTNMNFNEVIANRAGQLLGDRLGAFDRVHPNDHVNRGQSTNDVVPSAIKLACFLQSADLLEALQALSDGFAEKARDYEGVLRLGRTCMQAAQPMTYDQAFGGYASAIARAGTHLSQRRQELCTVPLGGTAIGTGLGAAPGYREIIGEELTKAFGFEIQQAANLFDGMQNADGFARFSSELRVVAEIVGKIGADLVILSSGNSGLGEVVLPAVQPGSSIMAGKVNPVMPMLAQQIAIAVHGHDASVALAALSGQLEINHFEPIIARSLFDSIAMMTAGYRHFREKCVAGLVVDPARSQANLIASTALSSVFLESLGYKRVTHLVKQAEAERRPFVELVTEQGLLTEDQIERGMRSAAAGQSVTAAMV